MKKVTAKEAYKIMDELGMDYGDDGRTFYAWDEDNKEMYEFDSIKERDEFIEDCKKAEEATQSKKEKAQAEAPNTKEVDGRIYIDIPSQYLYRDFTLDDWMNSEAHEICRKYSGEFCEIDLYEFMADIDKMAELMKEMDEKARTEEIDITEYVETCDREIAAAEELMSYAKKDYDELEEGIKHIKARKEEILEAKKNGDNPTIRRMVQNLPYSIGYIIESD